MAKSCGATQPGADGFSYPLFERTEALGCGSHVLIEKPLACSLAQIDQLLNHAKFKNKHIDVVLQKRYDPHIVRLKNLVREGAMGKIHLAM